MILLIITLYTYILYPYKKLIIYILILFFSKLKFYLLIILVFCLYIFIINLLIRILKKKLMKFDNNIYFKSYFDILKSYFLIVIFTAYYIVYLRFIMILSNKTSKLNVFFFKKNILDFASQYKCTSCVLVTIFIIFMLLYIIIFINYYVIFFFYKKHYIKVHYYHFLRSKKFNELLNFIKFSEKYFYVKFNEIYIVLIYIVKYLPKILILFYLIFNIFFNQGEIGNVIKILPFYSLYYFMLNIYFYIISKFNHDFDILVMQQYYKKLKFIMEKNELKKNEYIQNLLFENSKFLFKDSIYFDFEDQIEWNFLLIQTYKYSFNSAPNDFFTLIRKIKPELD